MQFVRIGVAVAGLAIILSLGQASTPALHAQTATVTGALWNDQNFNGIRDAGDPGLAGWELSLCQSTNCDIRQDTLSDPDGAYFFTDVAAGPTAVCLTVELHWIVTAASNASAYYCPALSFPTVHRVSQHFEVAGGAQVDASFGVAERNATMAAQASCPPFALLNSTIKCSLSFQNSGDISMSDVRADAILGECGTIGPDTSRCVYGPLGGGYGLQLVSSDPAWTATDIQHGFPYWDPLLSEDMQPGDRAAVSLTLRAISLDQPEQIICPTLGGYPTFDGYTSPSSVYSPPPACAAVTIVTSLPLAGDVNCDGVVNSLDALLLLQFISGLVPSLPCPDAADANGDGVVNAVDATLILQFEAGLISRFP